MQDENMFHVEQNENVLYMERKPLSESRNQSMLVKWAKLKNIPLVHIPNEGKRSPQLGAMMKQQGLTPGFPDLFCPIARGDFHGLFIEMKQARKYRNSEMLTKSWLQQDAWLVFLNEEGYSAHRAFGFDDAVKIIENYLSFPKLPKVAA